MKTNIKPFPQCECAEQQLTGFTHAKEGNDIESLAVSMGLTLDEWEKIKVNGIPMRSEDIEALDEYFKD